MARGEPVFLDTVEDLGDGYVLRAYADTASLAYRCGDGLARLYTCKLRTAGRETHMTCLGALGWEEHRARTLEDALQEIRGRAAACPVPAIKWSGPVMSWLDVGGQCAYAVCSESTGELLAYPEPQLLARHLRLLGALSRALPECVVRGLGEPVIECPWGTIRAEIDPRGDRVSLELRAILRVPGAQPVHVEAGCSGSDPGLLAQRLRQHVFRT